MDIKFTFLVCFLVKMSINLDPVRQNFDLFSAFAVVHNTTIISYEFYYNVKRKVFKRN